MSGPQHDLLLGVARLKAFMWKRDEQKNVNGVNAHHMINELL